MIKVCNSSFTYTFSQNSVSKWHVSVLNAKLMSINWAKLVFLHICKVCRSWCCKQGQNAENWVLFSLVNVTDPGLNSTFFSTTSVFRVPAVDKIFNKASEEASLFSVIIDPLSLSEVFFLNFPVLSSAFSSTLNILLYKTFYLCDLGVGNVWGSSTVKVNESRLVEPCSCHAVAGWLNAVNESIYNCLRSVQ